MTGHGEASDCNRRFSTRTHWTNDSRKSSNQTERHYTQTGGLWRKSRSHCQPSWIPKSLYQVGTTKTDWWNKCWQSQNFKGNSWLFWGGEFLRWIVTGDETWVHNRDPENKRQPMEYRHTGSPAPKLIQNQIFCWKGHVDCILELWRSFTHWLSGKRCYSELRAISWNPTMFQKIHQEKKCRKWWFLASKIPCEAWNCRHNWCHCTFGVYIIISSSPDLTFSDFREFPELK